jgi:hypothetical protein
MELKKEKETIFYYPTPEFENLTSKNGSDLSLKTIK